MGYSAILAQKKDIGLKNGAEKGREGKHWYWGGALKAEARVGHPAPSTPYSPENKQNKNEDIPEPPPHEEDPPLPRRTDYFLSAKNDSGPAESDHCELLSCLTAPLLTHPPTTPLHEYKNTRRTELSTAVAFHFWSPQVETSGLCGLTQTACREKKLPVIQQLLSPSLWSNRIGLCPFKLSAANVTSKPKNIWRILVVTNDNTP